MFRLNAAVSPNVELSYDTSTPSLSTTPDSDNISTTIHSRSLSNSSAIAGGVVGGVLWLALVFVILFSFRHSRQRHQPDEEGTVENTNHQELSALSTVPNVHVLVNQHVAETASASFSFNSGTSILFICERVLMSYFVFVKTGRR
jgi:hypothetical protein